MKKSLCIRKYNLRCKKNLKKGTLRMVFLTDIHNRTKGEEGERLRQRIDECRPDLILVGGDVLVGKRDCETDTAADFIKELAECYPVWYANGNHEQRILRYAEEYGGMGERYESAIKKTKAVRLVNERADIRVKGIPVTIYGFDPDEKFYDKGFKKKGMKEALEKEFGTPDRESYTILLAHTPRYGKEYLEWGADLTLSGHYHGGVMMLGKRRGLITPDFRLFSGLCGGIRRAGESHMIVSSGVGEHTVPVRINNPREITLIEVEFLT
ncbi:MAG: metallophosphoesterase [Clostridiales bacterium]|nr:metallophosphoesterase [Clostridiales bacterium]